MTLFKFICVLYQFNRQTLPIMKIDRGQIKFREYVFTVTELLMDKRYQIPAIKVARPMLEPRTPCTGKSLK